MGFKEAPVILLDKFKHKNRRAALSSHFSGPRYTTAWPIISCEVLALSDTFENKAINGVSLNVSLAYREIGNEVLRTFLLGEHRDTTRLQDGSGGAEMVFYPIDKLILFLRHFPISKQFRKVIPIWAYKRWAPMAECARDTQITLDSLTKDFDEHKSFKNSEALLYHLVDHDQTYRHNQATPLTEEFMELVWGGHEAMGHALTNLTYQLLLKPEWMDKLHTEVCASNLDLRTSSYSELQSLPHLVAVCKEGLRTQQSHEFCFPRCNKDSFQYHDWVVPANTPVSMSANFFHHNEAHFPDALDFKPERWLQLNAAESERYLNPFGIGSRHCLGMNLALEVIYRTVASVFYEYKLEFAPGLDAEYYLRDGTMKMFPPGKGHGLNVVVSKYTDEHARETP